jgi:small subunit ribosomal protein S18
MLAEFTSTMGRMKHSKETGLRPVNQRKLAKAVRRAIGMGFHPSVHAHPEILRREARERAWRRKSF